MDICSVVLLVVSFLYFFLTDCCLLLLSRQAKILVSELVALMSLLFVKQLWQKQLQKSPKKPRIVSCS
jgi:hypothetical protein